MALIQNPLATDYKVTGPLAGLQADQQYNDWRDQQQLSTQANVIQNQQQQNILDQSLLDNPVKAIQRERDIGEAKSTIDLQPQITSTKYDVMASQRSEAEHQIADRKASAVSALLEVVPKTYDDSPSAKAKYDYAVSALAQRGIKIDPNYSPEALAKFQVMGQMADHQVAFRQKQALQESSQASQMALHTLDYQKAIEVAKISSMYKSAGIDVLNQQVVNATQQKEPLTTDQIEVARAWTLKTVAPDKINPDRAAAWKQQANYLILHPNELAAKAKELGIEKKDTQDPTTFVNAYTSAMAARVVDEFVAQSFSGKTYINSSGKSVRINGPDSLPPTAKATKSEVNSLLSGTSTAPATGTTQTPNAATQIPTGVNLKTGTAPTGYVNGTLPDGRKVMVRPDSPYVDKVQGGATSPVRVPATNPPLISSARVP